MKNIFIRLFVLPTIALLFLMAHSNAQGVYLSKDEFLESVFNGTEYRMESLWLQKPQIEEAEKILGHSLRGFRIRFWTNDVKSAWILDEIGKERPITIGVSVKGDKIEDLAILAFRESRGWEVRNSFFTRQFSQAQLTESLSLSRHVDGISGATLSVRAVKKVAALALYFNQLSI